MKRIKYICVRCGVKLKFYESRSGNYCLKCEMARKPSSGKQEG